MANRLFCNKRWVPPAPTWNMLRVPFWSIKTDVNSRNSRNWKISCYGYRLDRGRVPRGILRRPLAIQNGFSKTKFDRCRVSIGISAKTVKRSTKKTVYLTRGNWCVAIGAVSDLLRIESIFRIERDKSLWLFTADFRHLRSAAMAITAQHRRYISLTPLENETVNIALITFYKRNKKPVSTCCVYESLLAEQKCPL